MTSINMKELSEIEVGKTFTIGDIKFIKLAEENGASYVITRNTLYREAFDDTNNNFAESNLLRRINDDIISRFRNYVHAEDMLEFETDLTSLDGDDVYGSVRSKVSLLTFDLYRKYVKIFDNYGAIEPWWLATPWGTITHRYNSAVCYVTDVGYISNDSYYYGLGIRPLLLLKSSMFVKD